MPDSIGVAFLHGCLDGAFREVCVPTDPDKGAPRREKFGFSESNANPEWASARRSGTETVYVATVPAIRS